MKGISFGLIALMFIANNEVLSMAILLILAIIGIASFAKEAIEDDKRV